MSHFAEIDKDGFVIRVVVSDSNDTNGDEGYKWLMDNLGGVWVKTSYNTYKGIHSQGGIPLHKNYAGVGYTFDGIGFAAPKPYPSWTLNQKGYFWEPPKQKPDASFKWTWDEETVSWVELLM